MEPIRNPRRGPRAPVRLEAKLTFSDGSKVQAETEDVSALGCQVVSARAVHVDSTLWVEIASPRLKEPLAVQAHVAWVSDSAPFRVGIAYEKGGQKAGSKWFDALLAADPGLVPRRDVPEKIAGDATIHLGPPPRHVLDFTSEEVEVLRLVSSGATAGSLRAAFRDRWPTAQYALFSLFTRRNVTLDRGAAAHPDAWRAILERAEAALALESLGSGPALSPAAPDAEPASGPARPAAIVPPPPASGSRPTPARPAPPRLSKAPRRTPGAQSLFERGMKDLDAGKLLPARAALEQALQLAPGDPEIARALAQTHQRQKK